jgi:hypothetical protein
MSYLIESEKCLCCGKRGAHVTSGPFLYDIEGNFKAYKEELCRACWEWAMLAAIRREARA